jgi:hypothetical protein
MKFLLPLWLLILPWGLWAQSSEQVLQELEDDTVIGGDIFSDFNEDLESGQTLEDERYYRYGRFFSVNLGLGLTTFTGNRGAAYDDNPPTFHFSLTYFLDFQKAVTLGVEYSKHTMILDTVVNGYRDMDQLGAVITDMTRVFVGFKYYIDTTDLGTAITYSNPHLIGRVEYWYQTNDFIDHRSLPRQKGGGIGTGIGVGLEFPVELKESYVTVQALYHVVNFFDKFTQDYRMAFEPDGSPTPGSTYGYDDLVGNVVTFVISYNFTW